MEITKDFEFSNIPFDQAGSVHLLLSGAGRYTVETDKELSPEDEERMTSDFVKAIAVMYEHILTPMNLDYQFPALTPAEFTTTVKDIMSDVWPKRGWELKRAHFTALYPDDAGMVKLIELKKQQRQQQQIPPPQYQQQQAPPQYQQQQTPPQYQQQQAPPQYQQQQTPPQYQQQQTPPQYQQQQIPPQYQQQQPPPMPQKFICPNCGAEVMGTGYGTVICGMCRARII